MNRPIHLPASTYRLQVHAAFTLRDAAAVIPYLRRLGVTTCYTAPYFTAAPGSTHGYDVWNHNEINPELGGEEAHREFTDAVGAAGMTHLVDFVPNHMGIGAGGNAWWTDVLENGPSSPAAAFFDIDWAPLKAELHAKLLLPILGDQYGRVLDRGELMLHFHDGALFLRYFDQELPINPRQAPRVFRLAAEPLAAELGAGNPAVHEFLSILSSLENLPVYTEQEPARVEERNREKEVAKSRLARLTSEQPAVLRHISDAVERVNGVPGDPASFDLLHELLEAQPYRLSYWRTASHEINYRRFFDVNTLAGLHVERPEVFAATHQLLGRLLADGRVHGVRVDHPDGLFEPARYFEMLQELVWGSEGLGVGGTANGGQTGVRPWSDPKGETGVRPWSDPNGVGAGSPALYVVAEKILSGRERLPAHWRVHGTTGYNFLNDLNGLFVDGAHARRLRRTYGKLTGHLASFEDVLYESKRLIMNTAMASELNVLGHMLDRIGEGNRKSRDFTLDSLRSVITEVVACFPVYRTYVDSRGWTPEDRLVVEQAIAQARRRNPAMEASLFDFFREVMLPRDPHDHTAVGRERRDGYPPADTEEAAARLRFAMKLQQYTGPVQAKGLEDTAFYRYNVLVSLNEVGGDPARIGRAPRDFHDGNLHRAAAWPFEMLATATHDTKLGEDVRARINILSEIPDEWTREVSRWMRLNRAHRGIVDGGPAPDRVDEYRFYQVLLGSWPAFAEATAGKPAANPHYIDRVREYMIKAVREAKVHTSWLTTNPGYEEGLTRFVDRVLGPSGAKFLAAFVPFQQRIARLAVVNSLAQVVLKIGSPGVPDFYQGSELWDLSLVDPDNRRPVDFEIRERMLAELDAAAAPDFSGMLTNWQDARIKMFVTAAGLRARRELARVFAGGSYMPLSTEVSAPAGLVAFARQQGDDAVLVAAPRLTAALSTAEHPFPLGGEVWKISRLLLPPDLAGRTWRNIFTGEELKPTVAGDTAFLFAGEVFAALPVAILRSV